MGTHLSVGFRPSYNCLILFVGGNPGVDSFQGRGSHPQSKTMKRRLPAILFSSLLFLFNQTSIVWAQLGCGGGLGPFAEFFCNSGQGRSEVETGERLNSALGGLIGFLTILGGIKSFSRL